MIHIYLAWTIIIFWLIGDVASVTVLLCISIRTFFLLFLFLYVWMVFTTMRCTMGTSIDGYKSFWLPACFFVRNKLSLSTLSTVRMLPQTRRWCTVRFHTHTTEDYITSALTTWLKFSPAVVAALMGLRLLVMLVHQVWQPPSWWKLCAQTAGRNSGDIHPQSSLFAPQFSLNPRSTGNYMTSLWCDFLHPPCIWSYLQGCTALKFCQKYICVFRSPPRKFEWR